MPSPHEVLGVEDDADEAEIHRAYRRRVIETHPDQGGSADEFQAVRDAYEVLISGGAGVAFDADADADADETDFDPPVTECRVEYLDYEVLDDHGWDVDDPDLFEKAAAADLDPGAYGRFVAPMDEPLLGSAEGCGFAWPYACRGGACANCAVAIVDGDLEMPGNHILPPSMLDRDIRLSCNGIPATPELQVVFNVKSMPGLAELRLPADRFERAHSDD